MQVNGFEISKFNIHNIPEGVKYHTCPLCSESRKKKTQKCLSVFWDTGMASCAHCGEVVQLHEWKKKDKQEDYKIPEWKNNTKLSDRLIKWFEGRGISQFVLRLMKISEGIENMPDKQTNTWKEKNTVQFPYYRYGEIINIKYRTGAKEFKLYKDSEKITYNLDRLIGQEIIYMCEGEIDVLSIMEVGIYNVGSCPNGFTKNTVNLDWINNDVEHFINAKKIILCFDNDIPGENGKREFIRRFGAHKCYTVDLKGEKDANDFLIKYGKEELRKVLENHIEIPLENVSTYNDFKEEVRDFFLNGMPKGFQTGNLIGLDNNFSVNSSHLVLVTGIPTSGKSEVVDQITVGYSIKHKIDTAYASVENKPNSLHLSKLVRKLNGITPRHKQDFNDSFIEVEKYVDRHFHFIDLEGSYDLERVLLKAEELVYRKGIKCLVIDPYNKVQYKGEVPGITGNRINDYTNKYLSLLNEFATKLDIIIYLVAHPVKMNKMDNGKRAIPDFYDVKGGGEFYDMCHHGLVVHRDYNLDLTLIKVLKCKFAHLGTNQAEAYFKYNTNNGRLNDITGSIDEPEGISCDYDNTNWITRDYNKVEQPEIDYSNNDLIADNEEWFNKENREIDEAPF